MNKTLSRYLDRNILFQRFIDCMPSFQLGIIIVIPCYDEPDVVSSIMSISNCIAPNCEVEIIVSINAGENALAEIKKRNEESYESIIQVQSKISTWLKVYPILNNDLPTKKAGVGLGRKIGMDEAVQRYLSLGKEDGVIVCFDADSTCDPDYLVEIERHFEQSKSTSASINYEHPIEGTGFPESVYDSIIRYELHLRYFIRMQKMIKLPYAFHTIGSSMACTVSAYCAVGGMNQRKAGEDFYFIHKLVKFGNHSELNTTKVIPSPRISDRVPFGTGKAVGLMLESCSLEYNTYHPQSFFDLEVLVDLLPEIYSLQRFGSHLPDSVNSYLESINANDALIRIINNTSDYESFYKMFWHWFDAFVLMKYLHYVRDKFYSNMPVLKAVNSVEPEKYQSEKAALIYFREADVIS